MAKRGGRLSGAADEQPHAKRGGQWTSAAAATTATPIAAPPLPLPLLCRRSRRYAAITIAALPPKLLRSHVHHENIGIVLWIWKCMQLEQWCLPKSHNHYCHGRNACQYASLNWFCSKHGFWRYKEHNSDDMMSTCHNSPTYILYSYIHFSAYLPQLAGTRYLDDIQKMVFIVG